MHSIWLPHRFLISEPKVAPKGPPDAVGLPLAKTRDSFTPMGLLHSVTFLFSNAKCREVPTIGVIKLLFECSLANSTSPFGIVRNCKGSYSQLKIRFFEKQFHYSDNPKDFHSPEGLLGIKSTTKKPIWIILTKYPKNGEPGIFKKVPRDKKNFSMKFLKI